MADIPTVRKLDLYRSLSTLTSAKLKRIRSELEQVIIGGEYHDAVTESGRSSNQSLLAQPHDSLRVVFRILARRGELTKKEIDDWNKGQPKTRIRVNFRPRYYGR